mgnify:CR=1 FL=1
MKFNIEVDCTPEEVRRLVGLPDLTEVHDAYLDRMKEAMSKGISPDMVESMMRAWVPMGGQGIDFVRELIDYAHTKNIRVLLGFTPFGYDGANRYSIDHPELKARKTDGSPVDEFGIGSHAMRPAGLLSYGQRKLLEFAAVLMSEPRLVLLDEPTVGLDPQVRQELWALIDLLRSEGTSILMSTHYIEEAERLCDSVTIVSHGPWKP